MEVTIQFAEQIRQTAEAAIKNGQEVHINRSLPYVAVTTKLEEFFFQGQEAAELLDSVPDNVNEEDFILFLAQGW